MNRRNNDQVVLLGDVLYEGNDFEGSCRVETGSGLVKEEKLGAGDQLRSDTDTTLLTTRDTLPNWCSNQVVSLTLETESSEERLNTLDALKLGDVAGQRQAGCEVEGLADGE